MTYNLDKQVGILCVYSNTLLGEFIANVVSCLGALAKFTLNATFSNFLNQNVIFYRTYNREHE